MVARIVVASTDSGGLLIVVAKIVVAKIEVAGIGFVNLVVVGIVLEQAAVACIGFDQRIVAEGTVFRAAPIAVARTVPVARIGFEELVAHIGSGGLPVVARTEFGVDLVAGTVSVVVLAEVARIQLDYTDFEVDRTDLGSTELGKIEPLLVVGRTAADSDCFDSDSELHPVHPGLDSHLLVVEQSLVEAAGGSVAAVAVGRQQVALQIVVDQVGS